MPATNGVTPLDADNVQWKAGDDTRSGHLIFLNKTIKLQQTTLVVPFYRNYIRNSGAHQIGFDEFSVMFPHVLINQATSFTPTLLVTTNIASVNASDFGVGLALVMSLRAIRISLQLASPGTNTEYECQGWISVVVP